MTVQAYVFVECAPGKPIQLADALMKVAGVEMAHAVTGAYDVIAFVRAESMADLGDLLSRQIHRLPGVLKTTTNVVVQGSAANDSTPTDRGRRA
jgi:DNA-binding Lrp family transcriptional regulator